MNKKRGQLSIRKIILIILASLFFSGGLALLGISGIGIIFNSFSDWRPIALLLASILACFGSCFLVGWMNSYAYKQTLIGALCAVFIGIPFSYFFLQPLTETFLVDYIPLPYSQLTYSLSFDIIWFLILPILIVEAFTEKYFFVQWKKWFLSILLIILVVSVIEVVAIFTLDMGLDGSDQFFRMAFYGPLIWLTIVLGQLGFRRYR